FVPLNRVVSLYADYDNVRIPAACKIAVNRASEACHHGEKQNAGPARPAFGSFVRHTTPMGWAGACGRSCRAVPIPARTRTGVRADSAAFRASPPGRGWSDR